jgi:hypothetical protein
LELQKNACSTKKIKGSSTDPQNQIEQKFKVFRYKNKVKFGAWKVRTLSEESGNCEQLECRMITNKINFLGVSETKIRGRGEKQQPIRKHLCCIVDWTRKIRALI